LKFDKEKIRVVLAENVRLHVVPVLHCLEDGALISSFIFDRYIDGSATALIPREDVMPILH